MKKIIQPRHDSAARANAHQPIQFQKSTTITDNRAVAIKQQNMQTAVSSSKQIAQRQQNVGVIQRGGRGGEFTELDKLSPEIREIKNLGKTLIGGYRLLKATSKAIAKGKNTEALKSATIGLIQAGVTTASFFVGIPGVVSVGLDSLVLNATMASGVKQGASTAVGVGLGIAESKEVATHARVTQDTTIGGKLEGAVSDKVGSKAKIAITLAKFIPYVNSFLSLKKSGELFMQDQSKWNMNKNTIINDAIKMTKELNMLINELNNDFDDVMIKSKNSTISILSKKRPFKVIAEKFITISEEFIKEVEAWREKDSHGHTEPILGMQDGDSSSL
jgi:hypothetical protein